MKIIKPIIIVITIALTTPAFSGPFKWIKKGLDETTEAIKEVKNKTKKKTEQTGRFLVEVGAGVTAAILYAKISKSVITIDGNQAILSESISFTNNSGNKITIPQGRYRIKTKSDNKVTIDVTNNNIGLVSLTMT